MADKTLVEFIKNALSKGISEGYIKKGLAAKNWPANKIEEALLEAKSTVVIKTPPPQKEEQQSEKQIKPLLLEQKPAQQSDQEIHISAKPISIHTLAFLGLFILFTFTILIYFYMNGIVSYSVENPVTNEKLSKQCLQQDCGDLKAFALEKTTSKLVLSIVSALIISVFIIIIYYILPESQRKKFFWIINGSYFLFLLYMAFIWVKFAVG